MLLAAFNLIWVYGSKARCDFHIDSLFGIEGTPFAKSFATNNETWRMLSIPFVLKKMRHGTAEFQGKLWHVGFELWLKSEKFPEFEDLEMSIVTIILYTKGFQPKTTGLMMFWFVPHHGSMDLPTGKAWVAVLPRKKHPKTLDWKRTAGTLTLTPKNDKGSHFPWSSIFGCFYLVSFGRYLSKLGTTESFKKKR